MKRIVLNLLRLLAVGSVLNLQPSAALAQGQDFTLLTTFTSPTPTKQGSFGSSVAGLGNDRVLIGATVDSWSVTGAGAVFMFSTNGNLLTNFTNPAPTAYDKFGFCVAGVEGDRVLVGAWGDDTGALNAGAAYLFSTDGALLTTFANPTPATDDFLACLWQQWGLTGC